MHECTFVCICMYVCIYMYVYACIYMNVCIYVCIGDSFFFVNKSKVYLSQIAKADLHPE